MRRWLVVQHVDHEDPGVLGEVLVAPGHDMEIVRPDRGEPLPNRDELGNLAGVVVLGGPMGVHDDELHPWLADERRLITDATDLARPVLGVCLGAQQLARALGAEVTTGTEPEVGAGVVELTAAGRKDPVLGPEYDGLRGTVLPCVHWHQDTFSLPDGAVHLAATRAFPHQAFRWGDRAYGFQFHLEVDEALARKWESELPLDVVLDPSSVRQVTTTGRRVLARWRDRMTVLA